MIEVCKRVSGWVGKLMSKNKRKVKDRFSSSHTTLDPPFLLRDVLMFWTSSSCCALFEVPVAVGDAVEDAV